MARFPLGSPVRVSWNTRDPGGTLANATGNSLTVKIANADGTSTATAGSPYTAAVNDSVGAYHLDVPAADLIALGAGHYQWAATATGVPAGVSFGDFDVHDPFEPAVLPLADGKDMLNIPQATTTWDAEIQSWIATIGTSMEGLTGGPLVNRTVTERGELDGTCTILQVQQRPVVSVISITPVDTGVPADLSAGLDIDAGAGIIRSKAGRRFGLSFDAGVTAVYVAGWGAAVPAAFNSAERIILSHLWETQHGPAVRPQMGGQELTMLPPFPYLIPRGAAELLNGQLNGMPFRLAAFA